MKTYTKTLFLIISLSIFQSLLASERLIISSDQNNDFNCEIIITPEHVKVYMFDQNSMEPDLAREDGNIKLPVENSWGVYFNHPYTIHGLDYLGIHFRAEFINQHENQISRRGFLTSEDVGLFALGYSGSDYFYPLSSKRMFAINTVNRDVVLTIKREESSIFLFNDPPDEGHVWIINNQSVRKCFARTKNVSR